MFNFQDGMDYNRPPKGSKGNKKIIVIVIFGLLAVFVASAAIAWYFTSNSNRDDATDKGSNTQQAVSKRSSTADRFLDSLATAELRSIIDNTSLAGNEEDAKQLADYYNKSLVLKSCKPKDTPKTRPSGVKQESYSCPSATDKGSSEERLLVTYQDGLVIFIEIAQDDRDAYSPEFIEKLGNL